MLGTMVVAAALSPSIASAQDPHLNAAAQAAHAPVMSRVVAVSPVTGTQGAAGTSASPSTAGAGALAARRANVPLARPQNSRVFRAIVDAARAYPSTASQVYTEGNHVLKWPIVDNAAIARETHDLILSAKSEVFIETLTLRDALITEAVRDAVRELARTRPEVPVYVRFTPNVTERTSKATETVERYFSSPNVRVSAWQSRAMGRPWSFSRWLGINVSHSKSVVVDNRYALISTSNLEPAGDSPRARNDGLGWHQHAILVEGPVAATIREQNASTWAKMSPRVALPPAPPPHPGFDDGVPMVTLGQEAGGGRLSSANQAYLAAFRYAERRVYAFSPDLNDRETVAGLASATAHTDIYIILSKGFNERREALPGQGGTNEKTVARLSRLAADPSRLHVRWNAAPGGKASKGNGLWASHAKSILVDDVLLVGSKNLDTQSAKVSRELSIAVPDRASAAGFERLFRERWESSPVAFEGSTRPAPPR